MGISKDNKEKEIAFFKDYFGDKNITYLEGNYRWYKKCKRWGYFILPIYKQKEFSKAFEELNNQFEVYKFIYERLTGPERIEFKGNYIDVLQNLNKIQTSTAIKEIILQQLGKISEFQFQEEAGTNETKTIRNIDSPKPKKRKALFHVISYILDSHANKEPLPIGIKTTIEKHAKERLKYTGSVNTFYKRFNEIRHLEFNKSDLEKAIGEDWPSIVLELSDNPEKLKTYLNEKM